MADDVSKSWFCVFNNPADHGYSGEPHEVIERLKNEWIEESPTRTGAWAYCISADGLHHIHMVLEDVKAMRFTAIKKSYAVGMHFEPTKGNKEQAEGYIQKKGKYAEKGEQVVYIDRHGEIKGAQGQRRDLEVIEQLIKDGATPQAIMSLSLGYRRYEKLIRDAFFHKRFEETPFLRDVNVYWHVGVSGSGKSFSASQLIDEFGSDEVYFITDYDNGFMDKYNGEKILFLDEYRGQIKYSKLLTMLQGYKTQIHARYSNAVALWSEVHITSVLTPDMVYSKLVSDYDSRNIDTFEQLKRRINSIIYHYKENEQYKKFILPMSEYIDYDDLIFRASEKNSTEKLFDLPSRNFSPFQSSLPL